MGDKLPVPPTQTRLATQIAALQELADHPDEAHVQQQLRTALRDRSSHVVAKAAEMCWQLSCRALESDLQEAYQKSFINPLKRDPGCIAKQALARALFNLETADVEPFRAGVKYRQLEPVWGGQEDTAAGLRAVSAAALTVLAPRMEALNSFADLLADPCKPARIGAARAIAGLGHWEGVPLLRLKIQMGDADPEVVGECCSAILEIAAEDNLSLVAGLLASRGSDLRARAALALGESHAAAAFEPLRACWESEQEPSIRSFLLAAVGLLRSKESQDFLVSLVSGSDGFAAIDAVRALAPFALTEGLRERVGEAAQASGSTGVQAAFDEEFAMHSGTPDA